MAGEIFAVILLDLVRLIAAVNLERYVVQGNYSKIQKFSYVACLYVKCREPGKNATFLCGGSIVNQLIILTAAHCMDGCQNSPDGHNYVTVGNENKLKGTAYPISKIIKHSDYSLDTKVNDIAVAKLSRELKFGERVKRVALMKDPPYFDQPAMIAGWGHINENPKQVTDVLMHTDQTVLPKKECLKTVPSMEDGFFCARVKTAGFAARGDSGSPLVVREYIQIGLVSHKYAKFDTMTAIYTDVGYYYDWIKIQVAALMTCSEDDFL